MSTDCSNSNYRYISSADADQTSLRANQRDTAFPCPKSAIKITIVRIFLMKTRSSVKPWIVVLRTITSADCTAIVLDTIDSVMVKRTVPMVRMSFSRSAPWSGKKMLRKNPRLLVKFLAMLCRPLRWAIFTNQLIVPLCNLRILWIWIGRGFKMRQ